MHYHDPDRPRSAGGLPQFLPPSWGILPLLEIKPSELDDCWEVSGWFLTARIAAARRTVTVTDIVSFLLLWRMDPEKVAVDAFGYSGPRAAEPPRVTTTSGAPSLEDLDL